MFISNNIYGQFLKEKRQAAGLTQGQVAKKFGYSTVQFVSNMERGISPPPKETFFEMMKLYKVSDAEIVEFLVQAQKEAIQSELRSKKKAR